MLNFALRRILYSIPVLLVASFLLFWGVRETFDPTARLRTSRDPETVVRERERLGLNDPIPIQYKNWLVDFMKGDWGESSRTREDVSQMIPRAFGNTIQLLIPGVLLSAIVAIGVGVFSAVRQYSVPDYLFTGLSFIGLAMPPFWFGLIAIQFLSASPRDWFDLNELPFYFVGLHSTGESGYFNMDYARHLVLPVLTLTVQIVASWSRYERASMLDAMSADYVRTARAKGVPRQRVIFKHAFRNALIPLVTVMALDIGALFGGLVVTEQIFSIPGMGRLFLQAVTNGDVNVVLAWMFVTAAFIIAFNLLADILYGVLDPRIRYG
jgi:peptide/nickel transport system permease protein